VQLTSSLDLQTILNVIIDYGLFLVEASNSHILLYDGEKLTFGTAQWDGVRQSKPMFEPRPEGLTYQVAKSGEELVISDSTRHPLYAGWDTNSMGAIIGLPLKIGVRVNGVMSFAFTEPHIFEESEIRVLELLADQAATAINNAQLYERIQSHADELEQRVLERTAE
jgi:GAF domain-containing protein